MKKLISKILKGPGEIKNKPKSWEADIIKSVENFTMTSAENITALIRAIAHVHENKIEGAIVECGVWKGGSMMAAVKTLLHLGESSRQLYLYDTFSEFSSPEAVD